MKKNTNETPKLTTRALQHFAWVAAFYVLLSLLLPASEATRQAYGLTTFEYHVVALLVAFPTLMVWLAAFIGYSQLRGYARAVRKTPEGIYFDQLAGGITWLAWSLPVSVIVPLVFNSIADNGRNFHAGSIIVSNYMTLILPLVAFSVIAGASRGLLATVKVKLTLTNARFIIAAFLLLGVLYCFATFRHFDLTSLGSTQNPYFLPLWFMVVTVTVPYLYAWFMGILAAFEITLFSRSVKGVLYKRPLGLLAAGLLLVILSSVAQQYTASVEPRLSHLVLDYRLVLTLLFRLITGGGFILIALGARRLQKIEEV